MRPALLGLAATLLAAPATGRAQLPRASGPPADLRTVRVLPPAIRRAVPHAPPRAHPRAPAGGVRRAGPSVLLIDPFGAWATPFAGTAMPVPTPPVPPRAPRTRVIEVGDDGAPADAACVTAADTRALTACLASAVRREDERLTATMLRVREPLVRTRPAAAAAAFDSAAAAWARYRERECRAQSLAVGGTADDQHALTCQLRLARERRALLEASIGAGG
ncbi:lysozyme inhibitor LprI family protein [Roseisolibacter agri]|uniref:Lysozyme inhibitor LprI-like N-terminal domain-containing protein n=1 Tax=Roseisolibacter agri TaxID=2014610 RepID=A0AA37Q7T0_9BACT|nr:lysozyme inhibitor LprI family protein [Roseisolibacter agri]GLC27834.1 hypothetical protein rosag_43470 [Roseisolibacter agri]